MAADIPTTEPAELNIGDTWKWTKTLADYPASVWTLSYNFKSAAGGFSITASASGDDHSVNVAYATTAGYAAGFYSWVATVTNGSERYIADSGTCTLNPDFRAGTVTAAYDARTHARIALDAIEAVIEGRATVDQQEYEIAGRRLKRMPVTDLLKFRQHYKAEVASEAMAEAIRNGTGTGRRIQFRL